MTMGVEMGRPSRLIVEVGLRGRPGRAGAAARLLHPGPVGNDRHRLLTDRDVTAPPMWGSPQLDDVAVRWVGWTLSRVAMSEVLRDGFP